jgi:APA family basic amino acid/polyamine antiporter
VALSAVTFLYWSIQYVVVSLLPDPAATGRPLAAVARQIWGTPGALLISLGALMSVYGYLLATLLHSPRLVFALGEKGDIPRVFARIHPRYHTPYVSIFAFAGIAWCLAVAGSFKWNVLVSSIGRLLVYGFTCAALPVLRRKYPDARAFRLPAGNLFAALGLLFVVLLVSRMSRSDGIVFLATTGIAIANWLWARNRQKEVA